MENTNILKNNFAVVGNGALLIWWGVVIMIDPLTIGIGAIGTGLIMLGVNALRSVNGIPAKRSTTIVGVIALLWGVLDHTLSLSFEVSFAVLLIVIGVVMIASLLLRSNAE